MGAAGSVSVTLPSEAPHDPAQAVDGPGETVRAVVIPFLVQRAALLALAAIAFRSVPLLSDTWHPTPSNLLLEPWLRYDASYYLDIAYRGYANPEAARFFPGYPWLVRIVALVLPIPVAAVVGANAAALAGLVLFHRFLRTLVDRSTARRAVELLLLFPTSFYLSAGYSESTYFLALSMTLLGWATRRPWLAASGVFLGTLSRPVGVLCLTLPFAIEWVARSRSFRSAPWFVLAAAPAVALIAANHLVSSGDPLAFAKAGVHAAYGVYANLPQTSAFSVLASQGLGIDLARRLVNWAVLGLTLVASAAFFRRGQLALGILTLASVGVPLLVQRTLFDAGSMGRYVLGGAPLVLVLAEWCREREDRARALDVTFVLLQGALVIAFAAWVWTE